jgi:hypothetical protein
MVGQPTPTPLISIRYIEYGLEIGCNAFMQKFYIDLHPKNPLTPPRNILPQHGMINDIN